MGEWGRQCGNLDLFVYGDLVLRLAGRAPTIPSRSLLLIAPAIYRAVIFLFLLSITLLSSA
jgi:hypothetical protein